MPDQWEYRVIRIDFDEPNAATLNTAGLDGWELVAVVDHRTKGRNGQMELAHVALLKRRR